MNFAYVYPSLAMKGTGDLCACKRVKPWGSGEIEARHGRSQVRRNGVPCVWVVRCARLGTGCGSCMV